jgi:cyclopropane fatty-acyl-phospholipid synthase-like methyltransferase
MSHKPLSPACENNKEPILQIIRQVFANTSYVLEIGSGTGQHACYLAKHLPHLVWQPTDKLENISGINVWQEQAQLANLNPALALNISDEQWPYDTIESVFTANTLHIMSEQEVQTGFDQLCKRLNPKALICIYGPFNYNGNYTSDSNARFEHWLKSQNPLSGIKNIEDIVSLAEERGLSLINDFDMPANNRLLVLQNS